MEIVQNKFGKDVIVLKNFGKRRLELGYCKSDLGQHLYYKMVHKNGRDVDYPIFYRAGSVGTETGKIDKTTYARLVKWLTHNNIIPIIQLINQ